MKLPLKRCTLQPQPLSSHDPSHPDAHEWGGGGWVEQEGGK